jgi:uncharacterized membrane protein YedE/YeeE
MLQLASLICGLIFGWGLMLSGMINPWKVLNFLDVLAIRTGTWDPSLIVVMAAALLVTSVGYGIVGRSAQPFYAPQRLWSNRRDIDRDLILGSAVFGVGWGLAGLCPGPALANLASLSPQLILFIIAMVAGMLLHGQWRQRRAARAALLAQSDG